MSYTSDISDDFFPTLIGIALDIGAQASDMLAVMYSESGVKADAWNDNPKSLPPEKRYNASGLIQFMPPTLALLGWTKGHAAFRQLSATEQLPFVKRYYTPYIGKLNSIGALYTATFLPAFVGKAGDPSFVLTASKGPLPWAYAPNASFDANGDLAITVGELDAAVQRNARGPRWQELQARLGGRPVVVDELVEEGFDLGTTLGIQRALDRLGFDVGTVDGLPGPRTRSGIAAFQSMNGGLAVDGVVGPATRAALEIELRTRA